jgi:BioD-like phosphotransacetylase family protein
VKSIYINSIERYSGKTAVCLALGRRFQSDGFHVGYLKPLSLHPGGLAERSPMDSTFVKEALG